MSFKICRLKKNEDKRLRAGHVWIYSNEIDTQVTPLKNFAMGETVIIEAHDKKPLGLAYINPHSLITARLFTRDLNEPLDLKFLLKHMQIALALREELYNKPYYRLIFGESDGLPGLVVDRYNDILVIQITTAGMDNKTALIIDALQIILPSIQSILLRNDSPARLQEHLSQEIKAGLNTPPENVLLEENNTFFYAPLWTGQKTGWFYDHRLNRLRLHSYVHGKHVLDVFSYLGGWGIQAACAGAEQVICIDSSKLSNKAISENAQLNKVHHKIKTIEEDAFVALKNLIAAEKKFDVIILDPPAFVKKKKDKKEGLLAYQRINEAAMKLLTPQGVLITCSCSMHVSNEDFLDLLRRASLHCKIPFQMIERGSQAPDHPIHLAIPETDYLKMIILRKRGI